MQQNSFVLERTAVLGCSC